MTPIDETQDLSPEEQAALHNQPSDSPEAAQGDMPAGFDQQDSDMTPEQIRRVRINMYFWHTVGFFLSPFAFALRLGRWSMRTLVAHHNSWEFGGF